MEEATVKVPSNVVEIRPGTSAQTDREREFVDYLLQKLRDFREMGVAVDSMMMCFVGERTDKDENGELIEDKEWVAVSRFIDEDRPTAMTLTFMEAFVRKYVNDCFYNAEC